MKNLIVYYSFTENNKKLAEYVRNKLHCDIVGIETVKKRAGLSILLDLMFNRKPGIKPVPYSLRDYDHIVFMSPIWAGKIAMPLTSFLIKEKQNVRTYSFITLCGGGNANQREKIQNLLSIVLGRQPITVAELWINTLLHDEKKNTIKYASGYRIDSNEFNAFDKDIMKFLNAAGLVVSE
jgi:flavodoxin